MAPQNLIHVAFALCLSSGIAEGSARADSVMFNEDVIVPHGDARLYDFRLKQLSKLRIDATGIQDAAKGFDVFVLPRSERENFLQNLRGVTTGTCTKARPGEKAPTCRRVAFRQVDEFKELRTTRSTHTGPLAAGEWTIAVRNTYNILESMTVRLKGTVLPSPVIAMPSAADEGPDAEGDSAADVQPSPTVLKGAATLNVKQIANAVEMYQVKHGHPPERLDELVPQELKMIRPDPWGRAYIYHRTGANSFAVVSYGPDGRPGGGDDISSEPKL